MQAAFTVRERTPKKSSSSRRASAAEGRVTFQPASAAATAGVGDEDTDDDNDALFEGRDAAQPSDIFNYSNKEQMLMFISIGNF